MANVGKDLLQVPFPEMVKAMATGIAEAQLALDMTSLRIAKLMSGAPDPEASTEAEKKKNLVKFHGGEYSLLELGFTPTFYQFVDTIIEIKMSISMSEEQAQARSSFDMNSEAGFKAGLGFFSASGSASLKVSTVSASFASKYQYQCGGREPDAHEARPGPAAADPGTAHSGDPGSGRRLDESPTGKPAVAT